MAKHRASTAPRHTRRHVIRPRPPAADPTLTALIEQLDNARRIWANQDRPTDELPDGTDRADAGV